MHDVSIDTSAYGATASGFLHYITRRFENVKATFFGSDFSSFLTLSPVSCDTLSNRFLGIWYWIVHVVSPHSKTWTRCSIIQPIPSSPDCNNNRDQSYNRSHIIICILVMYNKNIMYIYIYVTKMHTITRERSDRSSYYQSCMGRLDDIHSALKPLTEIGKNRN